MASMVRPLRTAVTNASGVNALGEDRRWRNNESCSGLAFIASVFFRKPLLRNCNLSRYICNPVS